MTRLLGRPISPLSLPSTPSVLYLFCPPPPPPLAGLYRCPGNRPDCAVNKRSGGFLFFFFFPPWRWSPPPCTLTSSNPPLPHRCITRRYGTELENLEPWNGSRGEVGMQGMGAVWREGADGKRGIYKKNKSSQASRPRWDVLSAIHRISAADSESSLKANHCSVKKAHPTTNDCSELDLVVLIMQITVI